MDLVHLLHRNPLDLKDLEHPSHLVPQSNLERQLHQNPQDLKDLGHPSHLVPQLNLEPHSLPEFPVGHLDLQDQLNR